jgi:hypothetical protein
MVGLAKDLLKPSLKRSAPGKTTTPGATRDQMNKDQATRLRDLLKAFFVSLGMSGTQRLATEAWKGTFKINFKPTIEVEFTKGTAAERVLGYAMTKHCIRSGHAQILSLVLNRPDLEWLFKYIPSTAEVEAARGGTCIKRFLIDPLAAV